VAAEVDVAIGGALSTEEAAPLGLLGFAAAAESGLLILRHRETFVEMPGSVMHFTSGLTPRRPSQLARVLTGCGCRLPLCCLASAGVTARRQDMLNSAEVRLRIAGVKGAAPAAIKTLLADATSRRLCVQHHELGCCRRRSATSAIWCTFRFNAFACLAGWHCHKRVEPRSCPRL